MDYEKKIQIQYETLDNLSHLLKSYVESYRLMVSSAAELYTINLAKKGEVKDAIERVHEIGDIIDDILKAIKRCESSYIKYCYTKDDFLFQDPLKTEIHTELDDALDYHN